MIQALEDLLFHEACDSDAQSELENPVQRKPLHGASGKIRLMADNDPGDQADQKEKDDA